MTITLDMVDNVPSTSFYFGSDGKNGLELSFINSEQMKSIMKETGK